MVRLTRASLAHPRAWLLGLLAVTVLLAGGLTRLRTEFGYRVLLGDDHPSVRALDRLIETFGGGLPVKIAWECGPGLPCRTAFDPASLRMADAVTAQLKRTADVTRVEGIATAPILVPAPDGFAIRRLVEQGEPVADAAALAFHALRDPLWTRQILSEDGRVGAIVVQPRDTDSRTDAWVVDEIRRVLAPFEAQGFRFHLVGDAVATVVSGRDLAESSARLVPITVLLIALVVFAFTRSWQSTAVTLLTLGAALVWTFGLLGWLGWPRDGILEVLAPLILVVGVCDAIHLLSIHARRLSGTGRESRHAAMLEAARETGGPCLVTTLTTGAAFLSFATSDLDTFVRFGSISAFGVGACLVLTFSLLPILAVRLPAAGAPLPRETPGWDPVLRAALRTAHRRSGTILLFSVAMLGVFAVGWVRHLRVDTNWTESWGQRSRVVQWLEFMESRLGPSETLELEISLPAGSPVEDPATLRTVADLSAFLEGLDGFGPSRSVLDLLTRVNRLVHGDDLTFERIGASPEANAELLELIDLDRSDLLASWLSLDRSHLRISVHAPEQPFSARHASLATVRRYVATHLPQSWQVTLSGEASMGFDWIRDVQATQLRSVPTALLLVLILVAGFLRSPSLAALAMIPTLIPIVVTLGAMGWMGMSLDVGRAMLAAVVLGIAVDDSIHLLHRYRGGRVRGQTPVVAIQEAVLHAGPAVITTSAALSLGFLALMASAWQTISSFGFLVSISILGALVATLLVLPAWIFRLHPETVEIAVPRTWESDAD